MRISDWSSDVCSSDLQEGMAHDLRLLLDAIAAKGLPRSDGVIVAAEGTADQREVISAAQLGLSDMRHFMDEQALHIRRSEEQTSELQSLMRISYAVFCLKKKKNINNHDNTYNRT